MIQVKGYAAHSAKAPLTPFSFERRSLRKDDILIEVKYCGICHSDIHQARDEWGGALFPMVPGHEIAGTVKQVGSQVKDFVVGDAVGVGCIVDSCRHCSSCERGLEQFCLEGMTATYNSPERDGPGPTQGGYSNQIVVDKNYVLRIPQSIPLDRAAPLLCAGITLYSPLMHWKAGPGKKVAILGLGGLGHMGVKIAHALGAHVTVLSHSTKKQADALKLGADSYFSTAEPETFKKLQNTFDLMINTVSAEIDWNPYFSLLKLEGSMVLVGVPEKPNLVNSFSLIAGRRNLSGSLIGGIQETQEMLDFCAQHGITPEIETISIQQVNLAFERVLKSDVRYRFVIDMATLAQS